VRPSAVDVDVRNGPAPTRWRVALPKPWPPPDATALVAQAAAAWRALRSVAYREHVASDERHGATARWRVQAPDRVAYEVEGGGAGIVVGGRRWDRAAGSARWVESPQTPLTQPIPPWVHVADAHLLATTTARGRRVRIVSFFDAGTPGWFRLTIDARTNRTLAVWMTATAHFMRDVYGSFDAAPPISPPR
jgi:hypothetical protein